MLHVYSLYWQHCKITPPPPQKKRNSTNWLCLCWPVTEHLTPLGRNTVLPLSEGRFIPC
jgi:hypothetical protein